MWWKLGAAWSPACSTSHDRRSSAGGDHAMDKDSSKAAAEQGLFAGEAWFDPIEAGLRGRVRGVIEELVEQELQAALGRGRYERGGVAGHRHGHRTRRLTGSVWAGEGGGARGPPR